MGGTQSSANRANKARSKSIDHQIGEDLRNLRKECKILLLGPSDAGKTTIMKQMRILHQDGFTKAELAQFRPAIRKTVIEIAQACISYIQRRGFMNLIRDKNRIFAEEVLHYQPKPPQNDPSGSSPSFPPELAKAIHEIWTDPAVISILEGSDQFTLADRASYFLREVLRISDHSYIPNVEDVLRVSQRTSTIQEIRFTLGNLPIHMIDVGGLRSQRKKWIHCFESVTAVIFCIVLSDYDRMLLEDSSQNRLLESVLLFHDIVNSGWFRQTAIVLFLNKIDLFSKKFNRIPLERFHSGYTGGTNINKAGRYILSRFMNQNHARRTIYPHLTQATDTARIRHTFDSLHETILTNLLQDSHTL